jgi:hypothetical protein
MGPLHHIPRQGIRALEGLVCCLCGQVAEIEPPRVVGAHDQRPARSTSRADEFTAFSVEAQLDRRSCVYSTPEWAGFGGSESRM